MQESQCKLHTSWPCVLRAAQRKGADLTAWNHPSGFLKGAWPKKGLHWTNFRIIALNAQHNVGISNIACTETTAWGFENCCIDIWRGVALKTPQSMGLLRIMAQKIPQNEGPSNIIALKTPQNMGFNEPLHTRQSLQWKCNKRRILDFMVWNLWQHVGFSKGFALKTHPKVGRVRGVALRLRQNVGSVSCGPKIQSDGFVLWCKITVTVRDFLELFLRKLPLPFRVLIVLELIQ